MSGSQCLDLRTFDHDLLHMRVPDASTQTQIRHKHIILGQTLHHHERLPQPIQRVEIEMVLLDGTDDRNLSFVDFDFEELDDDEQQELHACLEYKYESILELGA